ncbi:MAG: ABC transporter permease [Phycisphaera sp.]|nr:ABC transporter permease [Phycisphaera sp.]
MSTMTSDEVAALSPSNLQAVPAVPPVDELVIRPTKGWIGIDWKELWRYRELLYFLVWRDYKVRYKQTVLGIAWAVLQPVFNMIVFTVIFGHLAKIETDGYPYAVYVFAGLLPWTFFSQSVNLAGLSLVNQAHLLTKVYFPRLFVPSSSLGASLVDMAISMGVYAVILTIYQQVPSWQVVFIPFLVVLTIMATLGLGYVLAALTVSYRDFRYIIPFVLQAMMYLSPVVYPVSLVPAKYQPLLALNPMAGIIDGYRCAILGKEWNFTTLGISATTTVALFFFGLYFFRKTERRFADIA